jgi:hypothetical protein
MGSWSGLLKSTGDYSPGTARGFLMTATDIIEREELYTFAELACKLPAVQGGERPTAKAVRRWAGKGLKIRGSGEVIRLESVRLGPRRLSSVEAVYRFLDRLNQAAGHSGHP